MIATAQHSMITDEHGTPPEFVRLARETMGRIALDPASSAQWNQNIGATRIITEQEDFRSVPWFLGAPKPDELRKTQRRATARDERGPVIFNPPGDRRGKLVAAGWRILTDHFRLGWATSAVWIGFNVEQLSRLQRVGATSHPLEHVTLVPRERENYVDGHTGELQEDAPHASFVTLLTRSRREIEIFVALASELGHVVNAERALAAAPARAAAIAVPAAIVERDPKPANDVVERIAATSGVSDQTLGELLGRRLRGARAISLYLRDFEDGTVYGSAWGKTAEDTFTEAKAATASLDHTISRLLLNLDRATTSED